MKEGTEDGWKWQDWRGEEFEEEFEGAYLFFEKAFEEQSQEKKEGCKIFNISEGRRKIYIYIYREW